MATSQTNRQRSTGAIRERPGDPSAGDGTAARSSGPVYDVERQGVGTWLIGVIITVIFAVAGVIFGSKYNVLSSLHLPRIPIKEGSLATGGAIALAAILLGSLVAAILGGRVGRHYHSRVDRTVMG